MADEDIARLGVEITTNAADAARDLDKLKQSAGGVEQAAAGVGKGATAAASGVGDLNKATERWTGTGSPAFQRAMRSVDQMLGTTAKSTKSSAGETDKLREAAARLQNELRPSAALLRDLGAGAESTGTGFRSASEHSARFGSSIRGVTSIVNLLRAGIVGLAGRELLQAAAGMAKLADETENAQRRIEALTGSSSRAGQLVGAATGAATNLRTPTASFLPAAEALRDPTTSLRAGVPFGDRGQGAQSLIELLGRAARTGGTRPDDANKAVDAYLKAVNDGLLDAKTFAEIEKSSAGLARTIAEAVGKQTPDNLTKFLADGRTIPIGTVGRGLQRDSVRQGIDDRFAANESSPSTDRIREQLDASWESLKKSLDQALGISDKYKDSLSGLSTELDRVVADIRKVGIDKALEEAATRLGAALDRAGENALSWLADKAKGSLVPGGVADRVVNGGSTRELFGLENSSFLKNLDEATTHLGDITRQLTTLDQKTRDGVQFIRDQHAIEQKLIAEGSEEAKTDLAAGGALVEGSARAFSETIKAGALSAAQSLAALGAASGLGGVPALPGAAPGASAASDAVPNAVTRALDPDRFFGRLEKPIEDLAASAAKITDLRTPTAASDGTVFGPPAPTTPTVIDAGKINSAGALFSTAADKFSSGADKSSVAAVAQANGITGDIAARAISAARWGGMVDKFGNVTDKFAQAADKYANSFKVAPGTFGGQFGDQKFTSITRAGYQDWFRGTLEALVAAEKTSLAGGTTPAEQNDMRSKQLSLASSRLSDITSELQTRRSRVDEDIAGYQEKLRPSRPDPYADKNPAYFYMNGTEAWKENDPVNKLLSAAEAEKRGIDDQIKALEAQTQEARRMSDLLSAGVTLQGEEIAGINSIVSAVGALGTTIQQSDYARMAAAAVAPSASATPAAAQKFDFGNGGIITVPAAKAPTLGSFAAGGDFTVPGTGSGDQPYRINLTPGEKVSVTPRGASSASAPPAINVNVTNNFNANVFDKDAQRRAAMDSENAMRSLPRLLAQQMGR